MGQHRTGTGPEKGRKQERDGKGTGKLQERDRERTVKGQERAGKGQKMNRKGT